MSYFGSVAGWALALPGFALPACGGVTELETSAGGATGGARGVVASNSGGSLAVPVGVGGALTRATGGASNTDGLAVLSDSEWSTVRFEACTSVGSSSGSQGAFLGDCQLLLPQVQVGCGLVAYPTEDQLHVILKTPDGTHWSVGNANPGCTGGGFFINAGVAVALCPQTCALFESGKAVAFDVYVTCKTALCID